MRINKLSYIWLLLLLTLGCNEKTLKINYKIIFEANGGVPAPKVQNVVLGDTVRRPAAMTKASHTFTGWYSDAGLKSRYNFSSPVKSNLTLYAGWSSSIISHKVLFEADGGVPAPQAQDVPHGDRVSSPAAMTKASYTFTGWYSDAGLKSRYNFSSPVKSNLTLYAGWSSSIISHKVLFEADGGVPAPQAKDMPHGDTLRLPAAMTKAGYTFSGWYSDAQFTRLYDFLSVVLSPLTLYAKWGTMTNMPVTSSVIEGKYFVFDVGIPQQLTQDLVLRGSFAKGNIANYANDNDYTPTFEYSEDLGSSWRNENDMKTIRIKPGKTSVRVRVRTHADTQKEVLRERIEISFSPVGTVPFQMAAFTYKTKMVIEDDDVPQIQRKALDINNRELMRFLVDGNNVFILNAVIDSVHSQREKQIVDSLHKDIVAAVRSVNAGLRDNVTVGGAQANLLKSLYINFQQPTLGTDPLVLGLVSPTLHWPPNEEGSNDIALGRDFNLSLNSATTYWKLRDSWKEQLFNQDGVFGNTLVHEFGHILTLNEDQGAYYSIGAAPCNKFVKGGTFAGGVNKCFKQRSYGERLLSDFYDSVNVNPVSKPSLISPDMVSDYAATSCLEDLAESFAAYVGLEENLVVSDMSYAAYRNKIAIYKNFPQAVNFKQAIINTKLKIQKTGYSVDISSSSSFVVGRDIKLKYGGDKGCVRQPVLLNN